MTPTRQQLLTLSANLDRLMQDLGSIPADQVFNALIGMQDDVRNMRHNFQSLVNFIDRRYR